MLSVKRQGRPGPGRFSPGAKTIEVTRVFRATPRGSSGRSFRDARPAGRYVGRAHERSPACPGPGPRPRPDPHARQRPARPPAPRAVDPDPELLHVLPGRLAERAARDDGDQ